MIGVLLWLSIVVYGASLAGSIVDSTGRRQQVWSVSIYALVTAFGLLTTVLILRMMETGHAPMAKKYETLLFFAWSVALLNSILLFRYRFRTTELFTIPVILLALLLAAFSDPGVYPLPLILKTWWFEVHVITSFFAYALFTFAAAAGAVYLFKEKNGDAAELKLFQEITYRSTLWGFTFFSVSMLLGAMWAYLAWGLYWLWEPKSAASLLLWFYFAGVLHTRIVKEWRGRRASVMAVSGFGLVLFAYLGVGIFLTNSHQM